MLKIRFNWKRRDRQTTENLILPALMENENISETLFFITRQKCLYFGYYHTDGYFCGYDTNDRLNYIPEKDVLIWTFKEDVKLDTNIYF